MYPEGSCLDIFDVDNYVKQIMLQLRSLVQHCSPETWLVFNQKFLEEKNRVL